jgi:hypothetical protein
MQKHRSGYRFILTLSLTALIWPGMHPRAETNGYPLVGTVKIVVDDKPLAVPEEFQESLKAMGVTRLPLVDSEGQLKIYTVDGTPVDLCGPSSGGSTGLRTCTLLTDTEKLTQILRANDSCGRCAIDGYRVRCSPEGPPACEFKDSQCETFCE